MYRYLQVPTIGYGVAWPLPGLPAPRACVPAYDYIHVATCTQIYLLYACMQKHYYYALNVTMKRPISKKISVVLAFADDSKNSSFTRPALRRQNSSRVYRMVLQRSYETTYG